MRNKFLSHGIGLACCTNGGELIEVQMPGTENGTYSYMTILTASFSKLSPKMIVYSFGSTLYWLNMARTVTGSVADNVDPKMKHSRRLRWMFSSPRMEYTYTNKL